MRRSGRNRLPIILIAIIVVAILFVVILLALGGNGGSNSSTNTGATPQITSGTLSGTAAPTETPAMTKIVIASKDMSVGTTLGEGYLTLADVPTTETQNTDVVLATDETVLYGKLNAVRLFKGQRIHRADVVDGPFSNLMAKLVRENKLEPGKKAMAFAADDLQSVGQLISDGDLIDVISTFRVSVPADPPYILYLAGTPLVVQPTAPAPLATTKTILQNVRVLKTIQLAPAFNIQPDTPIPPTVAPGSPTPLPANAGASPAAAGMQSNSYTDAGAGFPISNILILGVTDQEAEVIKYSREQSIIHFVLRSRPTTPNNPNDPSLLREETRGATFRIMVTNYGVQLPELIRVK